MTRGGEEEAFEIYFDLRKRVYDYFDTQIPGMTEAKGFAYVGRATSRDDLITKIAEDRMKRGLWREGVEKDKFYVYLDTVTAKTHVVRSDEKPPFEPADSFPNIFLWCSVDSLEEANRSAGLLERWWSRELNVHGGEAGSGG